MCRSTLYLIIPERHKVGETKMRTIQFKKSENKINELTVIRLENGIEVDRETFDVMKTNAEYFLAFISVWVLYESH